jgi:SH3 domain protein
LNRTDEQRFSERYFVIRILFMLLTLLSACLAAAETRYVTDQFEITLRSGESTRHKIVRMLPSGSAVEVIDTNDDTGYSKIRTEDGTTGYVLTRQLLSEPVARDRIVSIEAKLVELQQAPDQLAAQLTRLQSEHTALQADHQELRGEKRRLEEELATIRHAAANVVRITEERTELRQSAAELSRQVASLQQENLDLRNQSNQRWFLIGAGVVLGGILLGLILPHLRFHRRRSSWGSL